MKQQIVLRIIHSVYNCVQLYFICTNTHAGSTDGTDTSPFNWTGLVDLEEEDTLHNMDACETNTDGCKKNPVLLT